MNASNQKFEYGMPKAERISVEEITHAAGFTCEAGYMEDGGKCTYGDTTDEAV